MAASGPDKSVKTPACRVLCILPRLTHPMVVRRLKMLEEELGCQVEIMAFQRDFYHGRSLNWPTTILGRIQHERYLRRVLVLIRSVSKIRSRIRCNQLVYAFHMDLALTALIARLGLGKPIILDVLDIVPYQTSPGWKSRLIRAVEKFTVERCSLLVLIASRYRRYYRDWLNVSTPDIVIEEKVESSRNRANRGERLPALPRVPFVDRPLRIGYFSVIRDLWSLEFLACLAKSSRERFEIFLAGAVASKLHDFDRFLEKNPGITYRGVFQHPDDLQKLYESVDMILACYSPVIPYCWSQSSRYYEACFFQRPLIVRAGTGDASGVRQHQTGLIIRENRPADAARKLSAVTIDDWLRWRANMAALPRHIYSLTSEADDLAGALSNLLHDVRHESVG